MSKLDNFIEKAEKMKYKGIDERKVKCCDQNPNTIEAGISFDQLDNGTNVLRFHFLELIKGEVLYQTTKTMFLDKKNTTELINSLMKLKFDENKNQY